ncbi:MAG: hypothetical protein U1F11_04575 [Steroidobacteraceae bacterium]
MPPVPAASRDPARAGRALPAVALATFALLSLAACGGGSGTAPAGAAATAGAAAPQSPATGGSGGATSGDLAIAEQLYAGIVRVPPGFFVDAPPAGVTGSVLTTHLKNSDVDAGATGARFELVATIRRRCSPGRTARPTRAPTGTWWRPTTTGVLELVRAARGSQCAAAPSRVPSPRLDRLGTDLASLNQAPPVRCGLRRSMRCTARTRRVPRQFTLFNNADHKPCCSRWPAPRARPARLPTRSTWRLVRAGVSGDCDRLEILRWTHAVDVASGALTRRLDALRAFRARRDNGVVSVCRG